MHCTFQWQVLHIFCQFYSYVFHISCHLECVCVYKFLVVHGQYIETQLNFVIRLATCSLAKVTYQFLYNLFQTLYPIFCINNHIVCEQRQFYFFLSKPDAFYLLFLPYFTGWKFQYAIEQKWQNEHSCLFPDFRGKNSAFSLFCWFLLMLFI